MQFYMLRLLLGICEGGEYQTDAIPWLHCCAALWPKGCWRRQFYGVMVACDTVFQPVGDECGVCGSRQRDSAQPGDCALSSSPDAVVSNTATLWNRPAATGLEVDLMHGFCDQRRSLARCWRRPCCRWTA